jgi:hydrogenase/urease accessory protein HupE
VLRGVPALLAGCACACSGGKAKAVEDARRPGASAGDAMPAPALLGPYRVEPGGQTGDVQFRVEWKDVPHHLRASPGTTACGTPAHAPLAPTVTWGIPEAFVAIDVDHGKPLPERSARVAVANCAPVPRVVVAGTTLTLASEMEQPLAVALGGDTAPRTLHLPVIGHAVELSLAAGSSYTVTFGDQTAAIVSAPTPYVEITEATGQVIVRDVPIGTHRARAWLPARGPLEARSATGMVTVTAGGMAEVTLDLSRP